LEKEIAMGEDQVFNNKQRKSESEGGSLLSIERIRGNFMRVVSGAPDPTEVPNLSDSIGRLSKRSPQKSLTGEALQRRIFWKKGKHGKKPYHVL